MGIRGLLEYMRLSSYLEDYELQNTDLIIDGTNLYNELVEYSDCSLAFGGNYDEFDRIVSNFFDWLLECNVKPLVLFQGSCHESQIPLVLEKMKQKIDKSLNTTPETPKTKQVHPLFLKLVFVQRLREMNIPLAQCQFDSENSIVTIAKTLNCPLLSNASYYYLYEALFIPSDTLVQNVLVRSKDDRKMIPCKIYRLQRFLSSFEGLNHHTLSLIDVLLSNNNKKLEPMVRNTIELIKKEHVANCEGVPPGPIMIMKTLNWLRKYTLEDAITEIVKGAPPPMRPELLKITETYINKYTNPFSEPFTHLMVPEECFSSSTKELYRFKGNINTLPYREVCNNQNFKVLRELRNPITKMSQKLLDDVGQHGDTVINELPQWFKDQYSLVKFPEYAICMMRHHFHTYPSLLEDASRPPSCQIAEKIFLSIFQYLISLLQMKDFTFNVVKRTDRNFNIFPCNIRGNEIISLPIVRVLPCYVRKKIIDVTLGIQHARFINALLPEWQLYFACLKYWRTHTLRICDKFHMYSLLTFLIYKLTTSKIGYYNSLSTFEKANSSVIKLLQRQKDKGNIKPKYHTIITVAEACKEIDTLDCLLTAPFFISHSQVIPSLSHGDQFKRHIIYGFSQLQCVLSASIQLNALLDCPYEEPRIANLYNGTLLYNLYVSYQNCEDMETYKNNIFKNSPSLLRAFNILYKFLEENEMIK